MATLTKNANEWVWEPLAPVTVTEYVPKGVAADVLTVRLAVPDPRAGTRTVDGSSERVGPFTRTGEIDVARSTVPSKLKRLVRVTVEIPRDPCIISRELGLAAISKSD